MSKTDKGASQIPQELLSRPEVPPHADLIVTSISSWKTGKRVTVLIPKLFPEVLLLCLPCDNSRLLCVADQGAPFNMPGEERLGE